MNTFLEIVNPSFLLFPALLGSTILGLVCPLVGSYLILRRAVFLGLTLPQIAAAGIAFTFWLHQLGLFPHLGAGDRSLGMVGSLLFTFLGMGLLGCLERRGKGLSESRLAAAYALAGALTILFIVFNPAGEIEILNLLKGEVIALSKAELRVLALVFAFVLAAMILFRREFLLTSFDRDLASLLKGGNTLWDVMLYLLAGLSIAIGVIMAGPLLLFGYLVLPPLAARPLVRRMASFLSLSSFLGVIMAIFGFYLSVRLDLPLGPTDVALGCGLVFLAYGVRRIMPKTGATICLLLSTLLVVGSCSPKAPPPLPDFHTLKNSPLWLAGVKNSTGLTLRLPGTNPLRSLAEMAGKVSPQDRQTVMGLLREALNEEFGRRGIKASYPEATDKRLVVFPSGVAEAVRVAREGQLSGLLFLTEIRRWSADARQFVRVWVDFKLVRIDDGALLWGGEVQRAVPTPSSTHLGEAYTDAIKAIVGDLFKEWGG